MCGPARMLLGGHAKARRESASGTAVACFALGAAAMVRVGCAGSNEHTHAQAPPTPPLAVRTAESRADIAAMATAVMAAEVCPNLRGRFLPIPLVPDGVPPLGDEPAGGRFFVRECQAGIRDGYVWIFVAGVGWAWVDVVREEWTAKVGVHQHVSFGLKATVTGAVDLVYDPATDIATSRFVAVSVPLIEPVLLGGVRAIPVNGQAKIARWLSVDLDRRARDAIPPELRQRVFESLVRGAALDSRIAARQQMVRPLGLPNAPGRPFKDDVRSLVNERQELMPGGMHIVGPFAATPGARIDFNVLFAPVTFRVQCEQDALGIAQALETGQPPQATPNQQGLAASLPVGPGHQAVSSPCPWYLITQPESVHAVLELRVRASHAVYPAPGL